MKQLSNLAVVCAQRPDVLFQLYKGEVTVYVGQGPGRAHMSARWDDDDKILGMVHELNFGKYTEKMIRAA